MSGLAPRRKGRRGEAAAKRLLADHDYALLADTTAGLCSDDLVVQSADGCVWSVEVKNCRNIQVAQFAGQARRNAGKKRWMLMCKINQTSSWLVLRKGMRPTVWHEKRKKIPSRREISGWGISKRRPANEGTDPQTE